ncbi:MAG: hypothetical protein KDM64_14115, partial [Verrucomicrobiae bacterium]|nr:hypothetical protein [Verrucomicrobiae bacterium]
MKYLTQALWPITLAITLLALFGQRADAIDEGRSLYIEGYPGDISYSPGEEAAFHISTTSPTYDLEIARIGKERTVVFSKNQIEGGQEYAIPEKASAEGCNWPVAYQLKIPADWKTGYYEVKMRIADSGGRFSQWNTRTAEGSFFFVVRPAQPGKDAKILLQLATNTYNAYNNWGGFSVYAYSGMAKNQGHKVSFERPPRSQFSRWELPFVVWCEENGYELDYATNGDLEFRPELLENYRLVLSVGHDEYWSAPMRDHLEAWIAGGGNVAFFSGNSVCWQVRSEDEGKSFSCFKQNYHLDPIFQTRDFKTLSTAWSHHLLERPENQLTGVG